MYIVNIIPNNMAFMLGKHLVLSIVFSSGVLTNLDKLVSNLPNDAFSILLKKLKMIKS